VYSLIHAFHIYYMIWVIINIRNLHTMLLGIIHSMKIGAENTMGISYVSITYVQWNHIVFWKQRMPWSKSVCYITELRIAVIKRTCYIVKYSTALTEVLNSTASDITVQIQDEAIHIKTCSLFDPSASIMIRRILFQVFHNCDQYDFNACIVQYCLVN